MDRRLQLTVIGLGCLATGAQLHFVREFMALFAGNELSLAVIFGCWFMGIVAGATLGGRLAAESGRSLTGTMIGGLALTPAMFLQILVLRGWRTVLELPAGHLPSMGLLLATGLVVVTPFSLGIGIVFPLACRAASDSSDDPLAVGRVYVLESAGAIAGGLAVGVLLAGWCPPFGSLALVSLPLLAGLTWVGWRAGRTRFGLGLAAGTLAVGLLALGASGMLARADEATSGWRFDSLQTGGERVAWADTAYQHLDLAEQGGQYSLFADGKLVSNFPDPYSAKPRAHLVLSEHPAPHRVLLLGPAFDGFAYAALAHPIDRLDAVELDPGVGTLVDPFLTGPDRAALHNNRVVLHSTDGRRFLTSCQQRWDLIFSDSPDPDTASLNRFFTREFFELAHSRLRAGGVFVTRIGSEFNLLGAEVADRVRSLQLSLQAVFSQVQILPGQETFLLACDQPDRLLADPDRLAQRYRSSGTEDPQFDPGQFSQLVQTDLVDDLHSQLEARVPIHLNTDDRPVTYLFSVLAWSRMTGDPAGAGLRILVRLPEWIWFAGLLLAFALGAALVLRTAGGPRRRAQRAASLAVFAVGALGMTLELVLSFAYQSLAGSLYQELGLIVAAFMTGLVTGGAWIQHRLRRAPGGSRMLGVVLLAQAAFTALLPWLQSSACLRALPMVWAQVWLVLLVFVAGAGTGVAFPLAGQISVRAGTRLGRAAGGLDAWDHLGAALGALTAGMLLIPLLGRGATCWLLASVCALAGGVNLVISRKRNLSTQTGGAG